MLNLLNKIYAFGKVYFIAPGVVAFTVYLVSSSLLQRREAHSLHLDKMLELCSAAFRDYGRANEVIALQNTGECILVADDELMVMAHGVAQSYRMGCLPNRGLRYTMSEQRCVIYIIDLETGRRVEGNDQASLGIKYQAQQLI